MALLYIKVKDNYIVNTEMYDTLPSSNDGETYHLAGTITGSSEVNAKYDSGTDSFIAPSQLQGSKISYFEEAQENGDFINYITGSTPATFSYNNNILSSSNHGINFHEGEISDVWIKNNIIGALLVPDTSSENISHNISIDTNNISFIENERSIRSKFKEILVYTSSYSSFVPEF